MASHIPSLSSNPIIILNPRGNITTQASKTAGFSLKSIFKKCDTCGGQGAIDCAGCKGTGKKQEEWEYIRALEVRSEWDIFERWKCYDCQGFGLKSCPSCGKGGLTPEQRGER